MHLIGRLECCSRTSKNNLGAALRQKKETNILKEPQWWGLSNSSFIIFTYFTDFIHVSVNLTLIDDLVICLKHDEVLCNLSNSGAVFISDSSLGHKLHVPTTCLQPLQLAPWEGSTQTTYTKCDKRYISNNQ